MSATAGRRLSPVRMLLVLAIVAGLVALGFVGWARGKRAVHDLTTTVTATWFAPYADITIQPAYAFEDATASPASTTVLGFVVADPHAACTPTWGAQYDLQGAGSALDLDRRIAQVRRRGGDVVISFGGVANTALPVACTDQAALTQAYRTVVNRYQAAAVDLDVEGSLLADAAANARQAAAVRALQAAAPAGHPLQVWLTLPATPGGLTADGVGVVDGMLSAGVEVTGVNVMAMDYGASKAGDVSMGDAAVAALTATHAQLDAAYRRVRHPLDSDQLWARMGATVMIGRNDVAGEVFSISDAGSLAGFAKRVGLRRVSMWSASRDQRCGQAATGGWQVQPTCSGIDQTPLRFTWAFLDRLGRTDAVPAPDRAAVNQSAGRSGNDSQAGPYPVWRADRAYTGGQKVVWQRNVYEAKWWTTGDQPDQQAAKAWDTPWRMVGPVLAGDATSADAAAGPRRWSADAVYLNGDLVRYNGFLYRARWRTQSETPQLNPDRPEAAAWVVVGRAVANPPPVFDRPPAWRASVSYAFRARVRLGDYVFVARRANRGLRPDPAPAEAGRATWKLVGQIPLAAAQTPG